MIEQSGLLVTGKILENYIFNMVENPRTLFVCRGNVYRSRLAEAYLGSLREEKESVRSAGVAPLRDGNGPISWSAMRILKNEDLVKFMSRDWTPLIEEHADWAEVMIVFEQKNKELAEAICGRELNAQVWEMPDVPNETLLPGNEGKLIEMTEETFLEIKRRVDELHSVLIEELKHD